MNIRFAEPKDTDLLIGLRLDFFTENTTISIDDQEALKNQMTSYFNQYLKSGTCLAVIAFDGDTPVSTAFMALSDKPPSPKFPNGKTGTILNVYTKPAYRKQGIGLQVVTALLEKAKSLGISSIDLSATEAGFPLYQKLGFQTSPYRSMFKSLLN